MCHFRLQTSLLCDAAITAIANSATSVSVRCSRSIRPHLDVHRARSQRITVAFTALPMRCSSSSRNTSSTPVTGSASRRTRRSPALKPALIGRTAGLHFADAHGARLRQPGLVGEPRRKRHLLGDDADARAPHAPVREDLRQHVQRRIGRDREADALRAHDHGGVDADHLAGRARERAARVAGIERGVGLDDVADQAAVLRAQRAPDGADDARRDGRLEAQADCRWRWRSGRGARCLELASRAAGKRLARLAAQHGKVGVGVAAEHARGELVAVGERDGDRLRLRR